MNDKILLNNMMFFGRHGVYDYERQYGQRFYVDVELMTDFTKAAVSDELDDALNYVLVYEQIKTIIENKSFKLLEALAGNIADTLLRPGVSGVTVRVRKPGVPLPGQLDYVQVETTRGRSS